LAVRVAHFLATSAVAADAPPFMHSTAMQTNPTSAISNFTWANMVCPKPSTRTNHSRSHWLGGVHRNKERRLMSELGLGCAKTPALAPDVEISPSNCISESQIMLHTRGSMPCWRIVFCTFRGCMSFYTWGNSGIEPYSGSVNQLSRKSTRLTHGPCNHGGLQWSTLSDWTYR